ncbi:auxin Efflux Carrier superfamily protein [Blastomyces gilchristii SLH14081]|uniref:Auxin Efflux Carrier superfamily protein n=1 Tax=Blastomyces gilchristii (strain SLH14081) TaxID=559298 RepID=A0A179UY65_BLAGS|nr:auxin Efflux Carrier superfamily protein [Blastomyces gilchristii SLH14081]OAT12159.1 auxin Efflux Carrier superfamily protein [Blastomyces gilchristii SLH14081]
MMLFTSPASLVNANILRNSSIFTRHVAQQPVAAALDGWPPHVPDAFNLQQAAQAAQPPLPRLVLLVFAAVLEVVCISLPGYIVARMGMFDADAQKFVANLNVVLFTPCLVFTKLASQLTADKLTDLAIIPCIFVIQTLVSYLCAAVISRLFRFKKRQSNFVIAMGVFGNSNSLPISLILSLSHTLEGLHWDRVPNDSDDEVGARGILYLLIFQQLGQLLRWSWGYRVLLAPPETYYRDEEELDASRIGVSERYTDEPDDTVGHVQTLIDTTDDHNAGHDTPSASSSSGDVSHFESGGQTPIMARQYPFSKLVAMDDSGEVETEQEDQNQHPPSPVLHLPPPNGQFLPRQSSTGAITLFPAVELQLQPQQPSTWRNPLQKLSKQAKSTYHTLISSLHNRSTSLFHALPLPLQKSIRTASHHLTRFFRGLWAFMNPPLWAMLAAIIVASIPSLQRLFFSPNTFIKNSVTRAVEQSGNVAVPLILVVLGANLARNTLPNNTSTLTGKPSQDDTHDPYPREERNLIVASLLARMLLPTLIMSPILALAAKFVPVSILDDPIFVVVCFLLTGAPSALQLAQICQLNNVYMGAMARLLFQSYVVWILPSTLILVVLALQVVQWATAT